MSYVVCHAPGISMFSLCLAPSDANADGTRFFGIFLRGHPGSSPGWGRVPTFKQIQTFNRRFAIPRIKSRLESTVQQALLSPPANSQSLL